MDQDFVKAELERARANLKVMQLQDALNDMLSGKGQMWERILFNRVRPYIADFCEGVKTQELYPLFKDLTVDQLLTGWGPLAELKPDKLKESITLMETTIDTFEKKNLLPGPKDATDK